MSGTSNQKFGEEWQDELMKLDKKEIINLYRISMLRLEAIRISLDWAETFPLINPY